MTNALLNTLERRGDTLAVFANPTKRSAAIRGNLITLVLQIAFGVFAWTQHSLVLILINVLLGLLTLPLVTFALWIEWRASKRNGTDIEIDSEALRFHLAGAEPIVLRRGEIAELMLMPSTFGQTLVVVPTDEAALRSRLSMIERLYFAMSKLYCGHAIGLTPNLAPHEYREFSQALDRTFPNLIYVRQKAHQPPLLARLLGVKPCEAPMAVHVPPPLSKA